MQVCPCVCLFTERDLHWKPRMSEPLGLDLQRVVVHPTWVLRTELGLPAKATSTLHTETSLQTPETVCLREHVGVAIT